MTRITVHATYPHTAAMAPKPIKAPGIWAFADTVRRQVLGSMARGPVDPRLVAERLKAAVINGIEMHFIWDFENTIQDERRRQVMGMCEHSPDEPGQIMISINPREVADRPEIERSTLCHELGHALFDMPAAVHERRKLRMEYAGDATRLFRRLNGAQNSGEMDWDEWRANEFMGAFLTPPIAFHQCLVRLANEHGLPLINRPSLGKTGLPILDMQRLDVDALEEVVNGLGEAFGVTPDFARVRIRKYKLITEKRA
jgi:hypothetical protein